MVPVLHNSSSRRPVHARSYGDVPSGTALKVLPEALMQRPQAVLAQGHREEARHEGTVAPLTQLADQQGRGDQEGLALTGEQVTKLCRASIEECGPRAADALGELGRLVIRPVRSVGASQIAIAIAGPGKLQGIAACQARIARERHEDTAELILACEEGSDVAGFEDAVLVGLLIEKKAKRGELNRQPVLRLIPIGRPRNPVQLKVIGRADLP